MGEGSSTLVWFNVSGFRVIGIDDSEIDVVVSIETDPGRVGCPECGVIARAKDRRWVTVRWRKRIFECVESLCERRSWTEQRREFVRPRAVLTERAGVWATDRVAAVEATPASLARELGVTWSTVWRQVDCHGRNRIETPDRVGPVAQVGFDETVMSPAKRHRRRRFWS